MVMVMSEVEEEEEEEDDDHDDDGASSRIVEGLMGDAALVIAEIPAPRFRVLPPQGR